MPQTNPAKYQQMVIAAALAAAIFLVTTVVRIPIPATGGYLNFGDAIIVFTALTFGPVVALIAGGVGSMAADVVGFAMFAIPTLIIKGILGLIVGFIGKKAGLARAIFAALLGESWMVAGYFITEAWVFEPSMGLAAAISELWFNIAQGIFGALIGVTLWWILRSRQASPA